MHEGPDQTDDISPSTSKCGTYEDESDDEMETIIWKTSLLEMTAYLGIFSDHRQTEIGMLHRDLFIKSKPCCNLSFSPRIHEQIILREIFKK